MHVSFNGLIITIPSVINPSLGVATFSSCLFVFVFQGASVPFAARSASSFNSGRHSLQTFQQPEFIASINGITTMEHDMSKAFDSIAEESLRNYWTINYPY